MKIFIGTSGWSYNHWKDIFYPKEVKNTDWLSFYSKTFNSVEINNTFYNLPKEDIFESWRESVSPGFVFSVKASRYLTHIRGLRGEKDSVNLFFKRVAFLQNKLGPILFQLPPKFDDKDTFKKFLGFLPKHLKIVFEFRNKSWYTKEVFDLLKKHRCIFCIHDNVQAPSPFWTTGNIAYIRMHGAEGNYSGKYSEKELLLFSERIKGIEGKVNEVYCYFNNDVNGFAVENALLLKKLLGQ